MHNVLGAEHRRARNVARNMKFYVGVDVGTGSVRSAVVSEEGEVLASAERRIQLFVTAPEHKEQSSADIWSSVVHTVQTAVSESKVSPTDIHGIGFDATCSLVALDREGSPVSVSISGKDEQNVILWQDHRAVAEAEAINATKHDCLRFVGGVVSPEMEPPKMLWLKKHLPEQFGRVAHFMDLADFLTFRCTGVPVRSMCTTVCKWCLQHTKSDGSIVPEWSEDFFRSIGLEDFPEAGWAQIGTSIQNMGQPIGSGLDAKAAEELGLSPGIAVATSAIDAHAGGIGTIGASIPSDIVASNPSLEARMSIILGTSACHMTASPQACFVSGVWGPYNSAMIPQMWLNEGGQSACGALLDHIVGLFSTEEVDRHVAASTAYPFLNDTVRTLSATMGHPDYVSDGIHVNPDFHGNRCPHADPLATGGVFGLQLSKTTESTARVYLAAIQALCYQTREIIDTINAQRRSTGQHNVDVLFVTGGMTKNDIFLQQLANITRCLVLIPQQAVHCMMVGSAALAAVASGHYTTLEAAMAAMAHVGAAVRPVAEVETFHERRYRTFKELYEVQARARTALD